jgi:hypothetical protein
MDLHKYTRTKESTGLAKASKEQVNTPGPQQSAWASEQMHPFPSPGSLPLGLAMTYFSGLKRTDFVISGQNPCP